MIQCLLNGCVESVLAAPCAKWSAACCKNNARDFFLNAGAQALSKAAVLAVHWQQCHSSAFGGGCHKRAGRDQSFFICKRNGATHFNGGQSGGQAREANHGGHDNIVTNNIFIECGLALGSAPWPDALWKKWLSEPLWQGNLLDEVDITKAPFTDRYPELKGYMDYERGLRLNHASRNVTVKTKNLVNGTWTVNESFVTQEDPGFVDYKAENFGLKEDAEVFGLISGFEPIPFGEIGLKVDEYRKSVE